MKLCIHLCVSVDLLILDMLLYVLIQLDMLLYVLIH
jgi:hypothetical protein